jgi:hypothetical protein
MILRTKSGRSSDLLRIKRENGGVPMDVCPASLADPAHILNYRTRSTAELVLITPISNLQIAFKNLRGGDNYALA